MSPKGPPSSFLIFCNRRYVNKSKRVPPFTFFGTMRHLLKEKNCKIPSFFSKKNVSRFLSLKYSPDFRRSRRYSTTVFRTLCDKMFSVTIVGYEIFPTFLSTYTSKRQNQRGKHFLLKFLYSKSFPEKF